MFSLALLLFASPPDAEAVRQQIIAKCGIGEDRLAIDHSTDPPEDIVALKGEGPLSDAQIGCFGQVIAEAGGVNFTIEDDAIGERYEAQRQAQMMAGARSDLERRGLLKRLPVFDPERDDVAVFVRGLERLCGARPGSVLKVEDGGVSPRDTVFTGNSQRRWDRETCAINAAIVTGFDPLTVRPPMVY